MRIQIASGTFHSSSLNTGTASGSFPSNLTAKNAVLIAFGRFGAFNGTPGNPIVTVNGVSCPKIFETPGVDADNSGIIISYHLLTNVAGGAASVSCSATNPQSNFVDLSFVAIEYDKQSVLAFGSGNDAFDNTSLNPGEGVPGGGPTTSQAVELLVSTIFDINGNTWAPGAGWSGFATVDSDFTQLQVADRTTSTAGTYPPLWTMVSDTGSSESWIATIALTQSGGGGGSTYFCASSNQWISGPPCSITAPKPAPHDYPVFDPTSNSWISSGAYGSGTPQTYPMFCKSSNSWITGGTCP